MHNLSNIDLNLLKLFVSLYKNGSVSDTADALNISQSACSHALTRLRHRLKNDLFVRIDNKMVATAFADQLAIKLIPAMALIENSLQPVTQFEHNAELSYVIAVTDYTAWCMQPLVDYLHHHYPNISLQFVALEQRIPESKLQNGDIDFACGFAHQTECSQSISEITWFSDSYVTIACNQHSLANQTEISLSEFLSYPHLLIAPWNESKGIIDRVLARQKKRRRIALSTPYVLSAPFMVVNNQWLLTLPQRYASYIQQKLPITIYPPPLATPNYQLKFYLHKTRQQDPKIVWFNTILQTVFKDSIAQKTE